MASFNTTANSDIAEPLFQISDIVGLARAGGSGKFKVNSIAYDKRRQTFLYSLNFRSIVTGEYLKMYEQDLTKTERALDLVEQGGDETEVTGGEEVKQKMLESIPEKIEGSAARDAVPGAIEENTSHGLERLHIKFTDGDHEATYAVLRSTPLKKAMDSFCDRYSKDKMTVRFLFDGTRANEGDTTDTVSNRL